MVLKLKSIDPDRNRYRFYSIDDLETDLFARYSLRISWGRIGERYRTKTLVFTTQYDLDKEITRRIKTRLKHGYSLS